MEAFLKQFEDLKIQMEEITSATNNFNDERNFIGGGGFGKVYKGLLSLYKDPVAFKRLDRKYGQGEAEFLKEITMLSHYRHENLISLLGFCKEGDEMILVYEYASRGSLDRHIASPALTWTHRLKICLDAAKGLSYLHDDKGTNQRLIHRDIKSANILLDDGWNAKVSDFGLSKMAPANQQQSFLVTYAAGTPGYCDPQYMKTYTLTKDSDVYSFGVVLFEVLCGTLCCKYSNGQVQDILVPRWIKSYEKNELNEIIFEALIMKPMDPGSLKIFSDIAYRCLSEYREDRPTMNEVVTELNIALKSQEMSEEKKQMSEGKRPQMDSYQEMIKTAVPPLNCRSEAELMIILSQGVLLNGGNTWFSLDEYGEHCELISIAACLPSAKVKKNLWSSNHNSNFAKGSYRSYEGKFKARVRAQFLSPSITYTVNLVFKFENRLDNQESQIVGLKYKLEGMITSIAYHVDAREDGWLMLELYQFTSDCGIVDLELLFDGSDISLDVLQVEGIEFRPLEKVEHKELDDGKRDVQTIPDSDANWEEKMPSDCEDIIKWAKDSVQWTDKKEIYSILRNGFLFNNGRRVNLWFFLDENGMKCQMLSARTACETHSFSKWLSLPESRFGEALHLSDDGLEIVCQIKSQVLSSHTEYASYLVYKLPEDQSIFGAPLKVIDRKSGRDDRYIYLVRPQTPVIKPKADENTRNPLNRPKIKGLPQQRSDGWVEVQVWQFHTGTTPQVIPMSLDFETFRYKRISGLIVQGIEFRPI